jgi:hypothetical protein
MNWFPYFALVFNSVCLGLVIFWGRQTKKYRKQTTDSYNRIAEAHQRIADTHARIAAQKKRESP